MTTSATIPVIDFSDFDTRENAIAQQVFEACKNFGLFYIVNHSISSSQIAQGFDLVITKYIIIITLGEDFSTYH